MDSRIEAQVGEAAPASQRLLHGEAAGIGPVRLKDLGSGRGAVFARGPRRVAAHLERMRMKRRLEKTPVSSPTPRA